ncbi:Piwi-domain-containing protein [Annulohypoxylon maeteangense]|uniref:Piwi-domain-containing protein n=1 Tax=Annulohypoxylon maeteangense TaxID=1927788 RepID=UPI002007C845|nr:Piwi-domain-containing protein [Annulohypoxylon maeteangense]KAI0882947.1 Piwi-domain-containing protein [Annulohypoxylon maeteangense]
MDRGRSRGQFRGYGRGQNTARGRGQNQGQGPGVGRGQYRDRGHGRGPGFSGPAPAALREHKAYEENPISPNEGVTEAEKKIPKSPNLDTNIIPRRPAYGDLGDKTRLWANYVEINMNTKKILRHYSIIFANKEDKPTGKKLVRLISLLLEEIPQPNTGLVTDFDEILISCEDITSIKREGRTFTIPYYSENETAPRENAKTYQIKVVLKELLPLSALQNYLRDPTSQYNRQSILQALNIFLNYYAKNSSSHTTIGAGRSFPLGGTSAQDLGRGLIAIRGYYSSIRLATSRILANINVSYGIFHLSTTLDRTIGSYCYKNGITDTTIRMLGKFLRGVRIEYHYRKNEAQTSTRRVFRIHDLASPEDGTIENKKKVENPPVVAKYGAGPNEVSFWIQGKDKRISILEFFRKERNKDLNPELPVLNVGSRQNPTYLPAELCKVLPGQRAKAEGNTDQTAKMIRFAVRTPLDNMRDIIPDGMRAVGLSKSENPMMDLYGISVPNDELITVESRVLSQPRIKYSQGDWEKKTRWNLSGKVLNPQSDSRKWQCKILRIRSYRDDHLRILRECFRKLKQNGVDIDERREPIDINVKDNNNEFERELRKVFKSITKEINCMIVILPDSSKVTYSRIKRLGDMEFGVTTVCIVASTLEKSQYNTSSLAGNLALKFNLKFGNHNQAIDGFGLNDILGLDKTMIVGIDVTHSPIEDAPSIAGMVASVDTRLGQWPATLRRQREKGGEMVEELGDMLKSRIKLWGAKNNGSYPENIVVYRDGVSEGQYKLVRDKELPQLWDACKKLYQKERMPKITIVVVGKRHHTRFYRYPGAASSDYNPLAGTIVDRGVTEMLNWDFFLQSHTPIKGTARPAHYFVVHDEIFREKFGAQAANRLETFTHSLCFLFGRSTCAVSICTPAYYADIVCQRARCYADDSPGIKDFEIHDNLKNTMFYI